MEFETEISYIDGLTTSPTAYADIFQWFKDRRGSNSSGVLTTILIQKNFCFWT